MMPGDRYTVNEPLGCVGFLLLAALVVLGLAVAVLVR